MRTLLILFIGLWSMPASAALLIEEGYVRGLPPGQQVTAAFMRLVNSGDKPVTVVAAKTGAAERAEIHAHRHHNGMMSMQQVDRIQVPANGEFLLAPGAHHLMLINLLAPLKDGDNVQLELVLDNGQSVTQQLPVRSVLKE